MTAEIRSAVALLVGVVTLRYALSDLMLNYVRPAMRPWLVASAVILCVLGAVGFLRATRRRREDDAHDHPPSRAAWLLVLPPLVAALVTPQPLGSYAAQRQTAPRPTTSKAWPALPQPTDGAVSMSLFEFSERTFTDASRSLETSDVRLTGFATSPEAGSQASFVLNRFAIKCCAADARIVQVEVHGGSAPPADSWVQVVGRLRPAPGGDDDAFAVPTLAVTKLTPIARPQNPYE